MLRTFAMYGYNSHNVRATKLCKFCDGYLRFTKTKPLSINVDVLCARVSSRQRQIKLIYYESKHIKTLIV